jgi:hypothetical protein
MQQGCSPLKPLELAKIFGVTRREIALRLNVTPDWLRILAENPRHTRRIRIAELEAILDYERMAETVESLICSVR